MQPLSSTTLVGRHVRLEPLAIDHVPGLVAAAAGPRESFHWTFVPDGEAAVKTYVAFALEEQRAGRMVPFATLDAASGRVLGSTRFCHIERWDWPAGSPHALPEGCVDAVEIGYTWLVPDAQRTPINTEAKRLMLAHAFEIWAVRRVTLMTDSRNARSRAAIERIGGQLDGVLRAHRPGSDGSVRHSAVYSILAEEWPAARARLDERLGG